jgi:hypothetical protein
MYLAITKLLGEYFEKWQIQNALDSIDEKVSGNKDELIDLIIEEWEHHGKNKYDLLNFIERPTLARICVAYGIVNKGGKNDLIKRIKKSRLLDPDFGKQTSEIPSSKTDKTIENQPRKRFGLPVSDRGLVIIIASGTIGILIVSTISLWLPLLQCGVEDQGLTYKNCPLNFYISRPSVDWSFDKNVTDFTNSFRLIPPSSLLGGVIVQSAENHAVSLWVLDGSDPQFSDLNQFATTQVNNFKNKMPDTNSTISPSLDKNSVLVTADGNYNKIKFSIKEKIEKHGDKVYILTTGFLSEQPLSIQELDGLEKTYESFGYLK